MQKGNKATPQACLFILREEGGIQVHVLVCGLPCIFGWGYEL